MSKIEGFWKCSPHMHVYNSLGAYHLIPGGGGGAMVIKVIKANSPVLFYILNTTAFLIKNCSGIPSKCGEISRKWCGENQMK